MHTRTARRLAPVVAAAALLAVGTSTVSAATPDDPKTTASDALVRLVEEPFRFSADLTVSLGGLALNAPNFISGEIVQPMAHLQLDLSSVQPIVASFVPEMPTADWTAEAILAGSNLYLRGGFFALAAGSDDDELTALVDEWGRVDLTQAAADDLDDIPSLDEVSMALAMGVAFATGAEEIGTRTGNDGSMLTGIRLDYDVRQLSAVAGEMSDTADDALSSVGDIPDVTIPIEVWIDADGAPRELIVHLDAATLATLMEASGEDLGMGDVDFNLTVRFDDVGDSTIAIKEPTAATDITHLM